MIYSSTSFCEIISVGKKNPRAVGLTIALVIPERSAITRVTRPLGGRIIVGPLERTLLPLGARPFRVPHKASARQGLLALTSWSPLWFSASLTARGSFAPAATAVHMSYICPSPAHAGGSSVSMLAESTDLIAQRDHGMQEGCWQRPECFLHARDCVLLHERGLQQKSIIPRSNAGAVGLCEHAVTVVAWRAAIFLREGMVMVGPAIIPSR